MEEGIILSTLITLVDSSFGAVCPLEVRRAPEQTLGGWPQTLEACGPRYGKFQWECLRWRSITSDRAFRTFWSRGRLLWFSSGKEESLRHLKKKNPGKLTSNLLCLATYSAEEAWAGHGVQTKQQPGNGDHVVLHKWLAGHRNKQVNRDRSLLAFCSKKEKLGIQRKRVWKNLVEESVQHANAENLPSGKGQAEHKDQVWPLLSFFLQIKQTITAFFTSRWLSEESTEFVFSFYCSSQPLWSEGNKTLNKYVWQTGIHYHAQIRSRCIWLAYSAV